MVGNPDAGEGAVGAPAIGDEETTTTSPITLRVALTDWLTARSVTKPSTHTTTAYKTDISGVAAYLALHLGRAGEPLDEILLDDLDIRNLRMAFSLFADHHAKASIARAQSTWRGLCAFAVSEEWLPGDPMSGIEKVLAPKRDPKPLRGEAETGAKLVDFLNTTGRGGQRPWPERDLAVIATLLLTGLRSAELRTLTIGDMFGPDQERRLRVIGKGDKQRTLPIEVPLEHAITAFQETRTQRFLGWEPKPAEPLFVSNKNKAMTASQLSYLVRMSLTSAGLGSTTQTGALVHGLRHTFATMLADTGATASEIMELMGHGSLNTSQGYIKASAREVRQTAAANPLYQSLK